MSDSAPEIRMVPVDLITILSIRVCETSGSSRNWSTAFPISD